MPLPGNADIERGLILAVVVAILLLVAWMMSWLRPRLTPQVPPTVAPLGHPLDEDVRGLRHWKANVEQKLPDLEMRVVHQGERLAAIQQDLKEMKQSQENSERMLGILIENGLRREGRP